MAKRNGFSELATLLILYPSQGQTEELKQVLLKNYTQDTLVGLLAHDVPLTRRAVACALVVIGDTQVVPPLVETLQHEDPDIRSNTEQALWESGFALAMNPLIKCSMKEPNILRKNYMKKQLKN